MAHKNPSFWRQKEPMQRGVAGARDMFKNRVTSKEKFSVISVSENSKNSEPLVVIVQYFVAAKMPNVTVTHHERFI